MALIIKGKTICPLCGKVIRADANVVAFPAFLKKSHPLAKYSDAAFHKECFDKNGDAQEITRLFERYNQIWKDRPKNLTNHKDINAWGKSAFAEFE
jgi:hypothetical protein